MREHTVLTNGIEVNASIATPQPSPLVSLSASCALPEPSPTSKSNWDIAQLRLPQDYAATPRETVQASIRVDKPGAQSYFRTHPAWQVLMATLTYEKGLYPVSASLLETLEGEFRIKLIVPYITRDGDVGLWPMSQLQVSGPQNSWTASAHRILVEARRGWVRMRSNQRLSSYELIKPSAIWDEPVWPEQGFDELLEAAFHDCTINSVDHPVVRALRGEG